MGQRSRKRGQRSRTPVSPARRATREAQTPRPPAAASDPPSPRKGTGSPAAAPGGPSRSEQRDAEVRAGLKPLGPDERPWTIRIAALIALLIGVGDLIEVIVGGRIKFGSAHTSVGGVVLFSVMMLIIAGGMWRLRYWAVLGFQAILGIVVLIFALLLIRASSLVGFAISLGIVGGGGYLFFKLVRVLSRLQMPKPRGG